MFAERCYSGILHNLLETSPARVLLSSDDWASALSISCTRLSIGLGRQTTRPQNRYPEFTIIFPPLLPTITLDLPEFTFSPLSRMLTLHSATRLPGGSIVGAIKTKSDAYINLDGRPLLDSLETTANRSGLMVNHTSIVS